MSALYDDGRIVVTSDMIATPTRIYPLGNATTRLRRDALIGGGLGSALSAMAILTYADLLKPTELGILIVLPLMLLSLHALIGVLAIDAIGHKPSIVITSRGRAQKIFQAIRHARMADFRALHID